MAEERFKARVVTMPSDALPLAVLAGIVACFVLHFGAQLLQQAQAVTALPARPLMAATKAGEGFDLKICNRSGAALVYVSVAYFDPLLNDWVARGWFPQRQGTCQVTMKKLAPPIYVFAETDGGKTQWHAAAGMVNGDPVRLMDFCIDRDKAFVTGQGRCISGELPRSTHERFAELPLLGEGAARAFTWEITDDRQ